MSNQEHNADRGELNDRLLPVLDDAVGRQALTREEAFVVLDALAAVTAVRGVLAYWGDAPSSCRILVARIEAALTRVTTPE